MDGQDLVTSADMDREKYQAVVRDAVAQLVALEHDRNGTYVRTPLQYADGSFVVVRVDHGGGEFLVSDFGMGLEAARMIGAEATYKRVARSISEASGVGFDSQAFFVLTVADDQLTGAIAAVANCSQEAVNVTTLKMSERATRDDNEALFDRLSTIFRPSDIARDAHIVGASSTQWHITSLVTVEGRKIAFEAVSKYPISVVNAAAKFGDIARLENAPSRVSVVSSKKALGTYLGVLSYSSNVIERTAEDRIYHRIARDAA